MPSSCPIDALATTFPQPLPGPLGHPFLQYQYHRHTLQRPRRHRIFFVARRGPLHQRPHPLPQPRDATRPRRGTQPLQKPHHHPPRSSTQRLRFSPTIALIRLRADKSASQRCRSSTVRCSAATAGMAPAYFPTDESEQSGIASTLPGTIQRGSPAKALPSRPSRTSSARKSANGPMSWRTLASSRAAMYVSRRSTGMIVHG